MTDFLFARQTGTPDLKTGVWRIYFSVVTLGYPKWGTRLNPYISLFTINETC